MGSSGRQQLWAAAGGDYVHHEIEADHWVGCWWTGHVDRDAGRQPDLDFRRDET
ncbi:MAG: hypothetical protein ACYSU7_16835 [Planctomycetota bacterium]